MAKEISLTEEEKKKVWKAIYDNMDPDLDRDPHEVISKDYAGNEDAYLRVMAKWHHVEL